MDAVCNWIVADGIWATTRHPAASGIPAALRAALRRRCSRACAAGSAAAVAGARTADSRPTMRRRTSARMETDVETGAGSLARPAAPAAGQATGTAAPAQVAARPGAARDRRRTRPSRATVCARTSKRVSPAALTFRIPCCGMSQLSMRASVPTLAKSGAAPPFGITSSPWTMRHTPNGEPSRRQAFAISR
jgi:hypothetical protein